MNLIMVRSTIKEENVADAEAALAKFFRALDEVRPAGVRYASTKLGDGVTFIAFLEMEPGGGNPLSELPAYAELLGNIKPWQAGPPTVESMTVIGSYHLI